MNNESWLVIHPTSNWVNYNSKMILYLSPITISVLIHSITSHESWIVSHDSRVIPPLRVIHNSKIIQPIPIYSLCAYILTVYNMNHESWLPSHSTSSFFWPRTCTLLPWSIPESFTEIGPSTWAPTFHKPQKPTLPPDPPLYFQPAAPAGLDHLQHFKPQMF